MFVVDSKGAQYAIDEGLRQKAVELVDRFEDVNYIELDKVIFLRMTGAAKTKWLGKCMFIGSCPMNIIPKFVFSQLKNMGLIAMANTSLIDDLEMDLFDLRFIIIINDDRIQDKDGDIEKIELITLYHELKHIDPDHNKLVRHNIEDFADIIDMFGPYWTEGIFKEGEEDTHIDLVTGEVTSVPQIPDMTQLKELRNSVTSNWVPEESD